VFPFGRVVAIKKGHEYLDAGSAVLALTGTAISFVFFWAFLAEWAGLRGEASLFPVMGYVSLLYILLARHLPHESLPGLTLSTYFIAMITRLTRATH